MDIDPVNAQTLKQELLHGVQKQRLMIRIESAVRIAKPCRL